MNGDLTPQVWVAIVGTIMLPIVMGMFVVVQRGFKHWLEQRKADVEMHAQVKRADQNILKLGKMTQRSHIRVLASLNDLREKTQADTRAIRQEIADHRQHVAEHYVRREDLARDLDDIKQAIAYRNGGGS